MERNWFSNFIKFDRPMAYQGMLFRTPEHFYQAMKSRDIGYRQRVANVGTPGQAKRLGKKVKLRPDWNSIKLDVMRYALKYKFKADTPQGKKLIAFGGPIIEWNLWHDNFWGKCTCPKCESAKPSLNHLGNLLMEIKNEL